VARLPRLSATVVVEGADIVIRPKFSGAAPGELVCYVEMENPLTTEARALEQRDDGSFSLPRREWLKPTLRYELGWHPPETRLPVFEPWAEAAL
jgi:hypothetical protein